ncbi:unnamed protein product [Rotaria sp. Silwood1]|nr:unnamed protein product [Rotaria sp. Silwood1]
MQSSDTLEFKTYKVGDNKQNVRKQISNGNQGLTAAPRVHNEYIEAEHTWYEEIAGVVSNDDDPNMLCSTFRVWFIGLFFVVSFTVVNTYFHYRMKRIVLDGSHIFLLSFVLGKFLAFVLPKKSFRLWPNTNYCFSFNPGPFTIKEHVLIVAMANLTNSSYALNPIDVQKVYYKKSIHPILAFGFILSSQLIGYGIAGPARLIGHLSHYFSLLALILIGAVLPIPFWFLKRKFSQKIHWLQYIHVPIILIPGNIMMLVNGGTILTWLLIGFISNVCMSRWLYGRYARLLSIATDMGNVFSEALIFFIFSSRNIRFPQWWGSGTSYQDTCLKRN